MNTSDQTTTSTASAESPTSGQAARQILRCPEWCTLPTRDHEPAVDEGVLVVWHWTNRFGLFSVSAYTRDGELASPDAELDGVTLTIEELRGAAANALSAAEWLEKFQ